MMTALPKSRAAASSFSHSSLVLTSFTPFIQPCSTPTLRLGFTCGSGLGFARAGTLVFNVRWCGTSQRVGLLEQGV